MRSRVTGAPSSKTSYVVLGSDPGPKKLEMIAKHKLKTVNEDGFLELIGSRPSGADDPKFVEQKKKEEAKVKEDAKKIGVKKGAVCVTFRLDEISAAADDSLVCVILRRGKREHDAALDGQVRASKAGRDLRKQSQCRAAFKVARSLVRLRNHSLLFVLIILFHWPSLPQAEIARLGL